MTLEQKYIFENSIAGSHKIIKFILNTSIFYDVIFRMYEIKILNFDNFRDFE